MIDNDPFFYLANKKNNTKLFFIYFSFHSGLKILPKTKLMFLDYCFMKYDKFFSHKKDITLFKNKNNDINDFKAINVFDLYLKRKKKNKYTNSDLKKIVFFDSNFGFRKSQSYKSYNIFLDTIIDISKNLNIKVYIKSKLTFKESIAKSDKNILSKLELIKKNKNITYLDSDLITSKVIQNSDLTVSLFNTTTFYESIYLDVPAIFFDPSKKYKSYLKRLSQVKYQIAYDKDTLIKNIKILKKTKYRNKFKLDSIKFLKKEINISQNHNLSKIFEY